MSVRISLSDGKYEFTLRDGQVVEAKRHGEEWPAGFELRHTGCFVAALERIAELEAQLNTPELHDFSAAVVLEAAHQRARWGSEHDAGKEPSDWFWLLGYLAGKGLRSHQAGDLDKALHHCISSAAVLANWHAAIAGDHTAMRPGIEPPDAEVT